MSKDLEIEVDIDSKPAHDALDQVDEHAKRVSRDTIAITRNVVSTVRIVAEAAGFAISQMYILMYESVILMAETLAASASAEAVTVIGAIHATAAFTASATLFLLAISIEKQNQEAQANIRSIIQIADTWRMT